MLSIVRCNRQLACDPHDDYTTPFVRGMGRNDADASRGARVSSTTPSCSALWQVTESDAFGRFVRILLLTAQRLEKVRTLRWSDIDADGVWHIKSAPRERRATPERRSSPSWRSTSSGRNRGSLRNEYVFAGKGIRPFNDMGANKAGLDEASGVTDWTLHDLRRTARSLMSEPVYRANTPSVCSAMPPGRRGHLRPA